jgi:hypothetical protein
MSQETDDLCSQASIEIKFTPPCPNKLNKITKNNLQDLLEEYYKSLKGTSDSFEKLSVCVRLSYSNGLDYFNGEEKMKEELKTMVGRVEQVVLDETDEIWKKKSGDDPAIVKARSERKKILRKINDLYNKLGQKIFGEEFISLKNKKTKETIAEPTILFPEDNNNNNNNNNNIGLNNNNNNNNNGLTNNNNNNNKSDDNNSFINSYGLEVIPPSPTDNNNNNNNNNSFIEYEKDNNNSDSTINQSGYISSGESSEDSGIFNAYENIPQEFKDKPTFNPYEKSHHLVLPARVLIVAPSGNNNNNNNNNILRRFVRMYL